MTLSQIIALLQLRPVAQVAQELGVTEEWLRMVGETDAALAGQGLGGRKDECM